MNKSCGGTNSLPIFPSRSDLKKSNSSPTIKDPFGRSSPSSRTLSKLHKFQAKHLDAPSVNRDDVMYFPAEEKDQVRLV